MRAVNPLPDGSEVMPLYPVVALTGHTLSPDQRPFVLTRAGDDTRDCHKRGHSVRQLLIDLVLTLLQYEGVITEAVRRVCLVRRAIRPGLLRTRAGGESGPLVSDPAVASLGHRRAR